MKLLLINLLFFFSWSSLFSQITVKDQKGNPIISGDTRIFNSDGDEANLITFVTNTSSSQIELNAKAVSISGTHGEGMEFCIGACYYGMTAGTIYPIGATHFYLNAGATSSENDIHFHHHIQTGDSDVTEYVLKIYENGNEANNFVQFTYKFDKNYAGINTINNPLISVYPNPATKFFMLKIRQSLKNPELIVSNILGEKISRLQLTNDLTRIETDLYSPGIYFASIVLDGTIIETKKIIIKK